MSPDTLNRARLGDSRALRTLSKTLNPRLTRMAAYYARRCREDAGDLEQEAWLGVLEALPRLDVRIGDPEQSLLKYARWRLLDSIRRSLLHDPPSELSEDIVCNCAYQDVLDTVNVNDFLSRLTPVQERIAICLLAGFTWREAGDRLGCTSANVAYHVRRIGAHYLAFYEIKNPRI